MKGGPGRTWIERRADGWFVLDEVDGGRTNKYGPYRWRWIAAISRFFYC
jgi:hypothetical protein